MYCKESNCVTLLGRKMWTEALQAHFLKPRGTNRLSVQHLVPQDCGAAQTGSSAVLETTADLLLRSSPPTLKTTTATCQTDKSLSQPSFICKKNPHTVCAARYRTNYGGNGGMYAKTPEKPLKNSQTSTNESEKKSKCQRGLQNSENVLR